MLAWGFALYDCLIEFDGVPITFLIVFRDRDSSLRKNFRKGCTFSCSFFSSAFVCTEYFCLLRRPTSAVRCKVRDGITI
ncbi:uncharacterized protein BDV17DRAFT_263458 [Aspergillus undulatus]|uniref:uncharacterized protein n=1 Tax=Aspergillus undulatus TaxID=1810928 RepID=UPI003CCE4711